MRWSGFLLGGIVGAAAVAYMSQKRPGSLSWAGGSAGGMFTGMKDRMIGSMLDRRFGSEANRQGSGSQSGTASGHNGSEHTIKQMINSDPEVKRQAEQIMSESSSSPAH